MTSPQVVSTAIKPRQALQDRWIGHQVMNIFAPTVGVTALSNVVPSAVQALQAFFGAELPKYMPMINVFGMSTLMTLIETAIRICVGKLAKHGDKVYVLDNSISRQKAVCFIVVGLILQTADAVVDEYAVADLTLKEDFDIALHKDGFITFASQFLLGSFVNAALESYQQEGGVLNRVSTAVTDSVSSLFGCKRPSRAEDDSLLVAAYSSV